MMISADGVGCYCKIKLANMLTVNANHNQLPSGQALGQAADGFVMCDTTSQDYIACTGHTRMVVPNAASLDFFTHFTEFIECKMQEWADRLALTALPALFYLHPHLQHDLSIPQNLHQSKQVGLKVLMDYKNLMKSNREFVSFFREKQELHHPEFLKDLYNLICEPWTSTALVIARNLKSALLDCFHGQVESYIESIRLRDELVTPVENYRLELIAPHWKNGSLENGHPSPGEKYNSTCENSEEAERSNKQIISEFAMEGIRQIESMEVIQQTAPSEQSVKQDPTSIKVIEQAQEREELAVLRREMEQLMSINKGLQEGNSLLRNQLISTEEDNQILREKCDRWHQDRKMRSASSRKSLKRHDSKEDILAELVELEVELMESRDDIELLASYINGLVEKGVISRVDVKRQLSCLKTILLKV